MVEEEAVRSVSSMKFSLPQTGRSTLTPPLASSAACGAPARRKRAMTVSTDWRDA